jgi:hypothetical protein
MVCESVKEGEDTRHTICHTICYYHVCEPKTFPQCFATCCRLVGAQRERLGKREAAAVIVTLDNLKLHKALLHRLTKVWD